MANESKKYGAEGGKKRAAKMTKAQRSEAAKNAAMARWGADLPVAEHPGVLSIGELQIPCSVLSDGTRVVSEAGFTKALGRARSGTAWMRGNDPGARMPHYAPPRNLISFLGDDLANELLKPIKYVALSGGKVGYGVKATLIPQICEAWLRARDAGVLNNQQKRTAAQAEILMRGLAHVGIIALVDEATGYQEVRQKTALAEILDAFIAKELRPWVRRFPFEFYQEIFRLKGWDTADLTPNSPKPAEVGRITVDVIYRRIGPSGILKTLKKLTPRGEKGYLKNKLHSWLTAEVGDPKLEALILRVITVMKLSDNWPHFMQNLERAGITRYTDNYELEFPDSPRETPRIARLALSASSASSTEPDYEISSEE